MRRVNLIPMAGEGRRFSDAGYTLPKPLVPVDGKPMILRAAASLPEADHWIFICRREHIDAHGVDRVIKSQYPDADVIVLDQTTEGQLCTCMIAADYIRPDDVLRIGACDNGMVYNAEQYRMLECDEATDAIIWTFRHDEVVKEQPEMYGWVQTQGHSAKAIKVSCKVPISASPMEDHAVIGAFSFVKGEAFLKIAQQCISLNRRINGEFYLDEAMQVAIEFGWRVKVFEVDRYMGWGTPEAIRIYENIGEGLS